MILLILQPAGAVNQLLNESDIVNHTLTCSPSPTYDSCVVSCSERCNNVTVFCGINSCAVNCITTNSTHGCHDMTIEAPNATNVTVYCSGTYSCLRIAMNIGMNGEISVVRSLEMDCVGGDEVCRRFNIKGMCFSPARLKNVHWCNSLSTCGRKIDS